MEKFLAWLIAILVFAFIAYTFATAPFSKDQAFNRGEPPVVKPLDDPDLNMAMAAARKTLPFFWRKMSNPASDEEGFRLKVAFAQGAMIEHLWLSDIAREDNAYSGTITNHPKFISRLQFGQRVGFTDDQISDWTFLKNKRIHGDYTLRALMKGMSSEQSGRRSQLAPLPEN